VDTSLLPAAFSLRDAREHGLRKDQVYRLLERGEIERVGRGLYRLEALPHPELEDLAVVSRNNPRATLCLESALVFHGLSDAIPQESDIALPRGTHHPSGFPHVKWRSFDRETFALGREEVSMAAKITVGVYSAPRTIIDSLRLSHQEGSHQAYRALRRWLAEPGHHYAELLDLARSFPKVLPRLTRALEVLG
jgi:predicted transcriptional regulator of viral defense system